MSQSIHVDDGLERIAALLDRLDPGVSDLCDVPGCIHHHPSHHDGFVAMTAGVTAA